MSFELNRKFTVSAELLFCLAIPSSFNCKVMVTQAENGHYDDDNNNNVISLSSSVLCIIFQSLRLMRLLIAYYTIWSWPEVSNNNISKILHVFFQ